MAWYNQLLAQAKACINPGFRFYQQKFNVQFHNIVRALKAACLCCPMQVQALRPSAVSVQELKQFSFITDAEVVQLVEELPNYLAIETEEGKVQWWASHESCEPCESCEPFCASIFFLPLVQDLGSRRSFRGRLLLSYRYKPRPHPSPPSRAILKAGMILRASINDTRVKGMSF